MTTRASYSPSWKHTQIVRYIAVACHEQGLGSVIMGIFDQKPASELLEIPEERELVALIPIGYPAEEPVAPRRKSVTDLLSYKS